MTVDFTLVSARQHATTGVVVHWPSGQVQDFLGGKVDRFVHLTRNRVWNQNVSNQSILSSGIKPSVFGTVP